LYETNRTGLNYYYLYIGIIFAIAIFSLPFMTILLNARQHQAMAQTLKNVTNTNLSSAGVRTLPARPSTTNVGNLSKEAPTNLTSKTPKDLPPTVSNLTFPINLTKPVKVQFKATDPDKNDTFTFDILRFPAHGKLGNISGDNISYTPNATFFFDNFTYRARDKAGLYSTNNGTVILDHPPTVSDQTISVNGTIPVRVQLAGSDPDQGDKLTFSLVQRPLNAVLSDPSGNLSTYYPNPGFIGQDKFIYRANDSAGLSSNNGTVSINVGKPLPTINPNVTGLTAPFLGLPASYYPLLSTVLVYAAIVALFMFFPLVYDMRKAYGQKGKPSGEATGFPDLARSLMAFGIIIILAILAFHVLATVTYNVLPSTTNNALVEIIKNLSTILGGAVSAIIGFYFGQRSAEKRPTGAAGTAVGGPTVVSTVPSDGAHPVPVDTAVTATFSEPVTVEPNSLTLKDMNNKRVEGTTGVSTDGKTLTFNKTSNLTPSTTYIATITGVKDLAGNTISSPKTWKFTTTDPGKV
jgi:hypothetical protein